MKKKVLIVTNHRKNRSPSQRFRFEQYLDYLREHEFEFTFDFLLNEKDDELFYSKKSILLKTILILKLFLKRYKTLRSASAYDIVFIHREFFIIGGPFFERRLKKINPNIIFDFDDSIWLKNISKGNEKFKWLKNSKKTAEIISLSKLIMAGNKYLADYALQFNSQVKVVPTTIDLNYHQSHPLSANKIIIGWTGSSTTLKYFEELLPALEIIKKKYQNKVDFKIIVDTNIHYPSIESHTTLWNIETEIEELNKIDIGIMPLPDNQWTKGKCGFKGLQYMSLGIPTIMSPVGVNKDIIADSENGYLANTINEWVDKISLLIESEELRKTIGNNGQKTIVEQYSVDANKQLYLSCFNSVFESSN